MPVAVSIQQLHKRFGELKALNGVDLQIAEGELSGCWAQTELANRR